MAALVEDGSWADKRCSVMVFISEQQEHHQHHRRCSVLLQKIAGEQRTWPACPTGCCHWAAAHT